MLESRLLDARDDLLRRAADVSAKHAANVAAARAHRVDPARAGKALEAIATTRSYRIGGHATFDAFARAELGFSRATAHRLRARAAEPSSEAADEAAQAAARLRRWLDARGVRPKSVTAHRRSSRVTVVLDAAEIVRLTARRKRR